MELPLTSQTLLSKLKNPDGGPLWQASWTRFHQLYHHPLKAMARSCYLRHTGNQQPSVTFIEEVVANVTAEYFLRSQHRYDASKGSFRGFLWVLTNARVVDLLRKERPLDHLALDQAELDAMLQESDHERTIFRSSVLASLLEDLRIHSPTRQFEIFERVKIKNQSPEFVAEEMGITRAMVDRYIYKAMTKLRQLAQQPEYLEESGD